MRVGLNATCFNDRPSGANQRFAGIYGALIARHPDIEFVIYEPVDCKVGGWFASAPNVTRRTTPMPSAHRLRRLANGFRFWREAFATDKLDLFETFHLPLVRAPRCPTILTVHDARPVLRDVPWPQRSVNRHILVNALRNADHVITVSQTMRDELLGIEPAATITSVYNGIDPRPFRSPSPAESEELRRRLALPPHFILAVGHLEARKNYRRLIEALAHLDPSIGLVIVGNDSGEGDALRARVAALGLDKRVRLLSGVPTDDLDQLFALSTMVAFPSTYEGFGIPVLEAMAASRPVVLSDIKVFRELTENNGCYFPPEDVEAIAQTIAGLFLDDARRQSLINYGRRRVRDFAFGKLAAEVEGIYAHVLPS